jgi:UDP-2,4-diacetamido-2,4,6-trideoxy-beta-L-altropyranose hydrolase
MADQIKSAGHSLMLLSTDEKPTTAVSNDQPLKHASWLGAPWEKDADDTIQCLLKVALTRLVVDHYAIDARWERKVKNATGVKIMVIDGLGDRAHDCDLLLDQTCSPEGEDRWKYLVPPDCKLFVGPQYALLRPEFIAARRTLRQRDGIVRRVFIAFGGVDELNATGAALDAVLAQNRPDIAVDVVVGMANPHRYELQERCQIFTNITIHIQPSNMAEMMAAADLAIGGGGTMLWERCLLGLPSIVVAIAQNQVMQSRQLAILGAVEYLGLLNQSGIKSMLITKLKAMIQDPQCVKSIERKCIVLISQPTTSFVDEIFSPSHPQKGGRL